MDIKEAVRILIDMTDEELIEAIRSSQDLTPEASDELEKMVKNVDRALGNIETIMESDKRSFTNKVTENGYLFDAIWNVHEILNNHR